MMRFILMTGKWGVFILLSLFTVLTLQVIFFFFKKDKNKLVLLFLISFIPFLIGVLGTIISYLSMLNIISMASEVSTELLRQASIESLYPLWTGVGAALIALVFAFINLILYKRNTDS